MIQSSGPEATKPKPDHWRRVTTQEHTVRVTDAEQVNTEEER